jgi:hypothetical protein
MKKQTTSALASLAFVSACATPPSGLGLANNLVWQSGFENGFPAFEWFEDDGGSYSASGAMPADRLSAWTIVNRRSGEPVFSGEFAYKGWIVGSAATPHRSYPVVHTDIPTPLVNTFMVYLDVDYQHMSRDSWIHLGTWGNRDAIMKTGKWALHTMAIRERKIEFAHTDPFHGQYIGPMPQPTFPLRRWVRLTVYILYENVTGFVQVWQDGVPMLRAQVAALATTPGSGLRTAHWGMYASGSMDHGVQYNDDITICTLGSPLIDLTAEPVCVASKASDPADNPGASTAKPGLGMTIIYNHCK